MIKLCNTFPFSHIIADNLSVLDMDPSILGDEPVNITDELSVSNVRQDRIEWKARHGCPSKGGV